MVKKEGCEVIQDKKGARRFFKRYVCPRFTKPDAQRILRLISAIMFCNRSVEFEYKTFSDR